MGPQLSSSTSSSPSSTPTLAPPLSPVASSTTLTPLASTDSQTLNRASNPYSQNNQSNLVDNNSSRNSSSGSIISSSSSSSINNSSSSNIDLSNNSFQYHQQYEDSNMRTSCYLASRDIGQSNDVIHQDNQYQTTYYNHCCQSCNQSQPCKCLDHQLQDTSSIAQSDSFHFGRTQAHQLPLISTSTNDNLGYQKKGFQTLISINDTLQQQRPPSSTYDQYQMQKHHQILVHEDNQILISDSRNQANDSLLNNNQVAYNTGYSDTTELKASSSCNLNNWTITHDSCSSRTLNLNDTAYDNLLFHDVLNNEDKQGTKILHQRQQQQQQQKITPNDFNNNQQHNFSMLLNSQNLPQVQESSHCLSSQRQADPHQHLIEQSLVPNSGFYISTPSEGFLTTNQQSRGQYASANFSHQHMEHDSSLIKDPSNELQKSSSLTPLDNLGMHQSNHHNGFSGFDHIPQHNNHFQCQDSIEENYLKQQPFDNVLFPDTDNQLNIQQQQHQNQRIYQPVQLQILDRQSNKPSCDSVLVDRQQQHEPQQHLRQQHISTLPRENQYAFEDEYPAFHQLAMNCDNYNNQVTTTTTVSSEINQSTHKVRPFKGRRGRPRKKGLRSKNKVNGKLWEFIRDLLLSERTNPSFIRWERREDGIFKFVQSDKVAKMWGERKQNPKMTYEKLSRAMRYYYKSKVLLPVFGRRLVYKFGPNATGWMHKDDDEVYL